MNNITLDYVGGKVIPGGVVVHLSKNLQVWKGLEVKDDRTNRSLNRGYVEEMTYIFVPDNGYVDFYVSEQNAVIIKELVRDGLFAYVDSSHERLIDALVAPVEEPAKRVSRKKVDTKQEILDPVGE